ncbi:MAG: thymidine kinase [Clostridia bacterium]|nr:thymidine kinase [Clostridia bacterium]
MSKLYFKYGTMGSSKTAQALMCRFNYITKGFNVLLVKPSTDTRSPKVKSRIGLEADCEIIGNNESFFDLFKQHNPQVIIVDECQFLTETQVDELKELTAQIPVLCFGLLTNFKTKLFEGSKRLIELADSISEIKSVCKCGKKAIINARLINGEVVVDGPEILIGADETYEGRCYWCYKNKK